MQTKKIIPAAADALKIEILPTEALVPFAQNSRTHSDDQISQIVASIKEFGFTNPVLVDSENGIIAGHGRVMAAKKLALSEVPCIRLGHLTEKQKRAYVIADNKLALNAGWDDELLKAEFLDLREEGFDLSLTGFGAAELAAFLENSTQEENLPGDGGLDGEKKVECPHCKRWFTLKE
ncbi:MAG: ParB/Srx family N-terminal domain-containing protein [Verrucomicrobium sp.]|nr:ParB/Srx family N-terminal domain-containing protein [Verrucomicrobium sp.]